jgi:hypothetical protein
MMLATFSTTTFEITSLSVMAISILTFCKITVGLTALSIMTFGIMTFYRITLSLTIIKYGTQHHYNRHHSKKIRN